MNISELTAISPIDGRYRKKVERLDEYFSEFGLIRARVMVEVEYFIALCQLPLPQLASFDPKYFRKLRNIVKNFKVADAQEIKEIEKTTNHDVKAVEYFLKRRFDEMNLTQFKEFIHFGLTSQDINNSAVPFTMKEANRELVIPAIEKIINRLGELANEWRDVPMLAHTHGQPASPTHLGKEIYVFVERLENQLNELKRLPFENKFGGATGNMNAHKVAYPQFDWKEFAAKFSKKLGLKRQETTTQIEHYDVMAEYFDTIKRINTILIDLSRDIWMYISMDYFKQKIKAGEVGSSAMPHKVNPIDFENAEGNLGMANAISQSYNYIRKLERIQAPRVVIYVHKVLLYMKSVHLFDYFKASDKRVDFLSKLNEHKMGCVVYNDHMNMKDTAKRRDWSACYRSFVNQICPPLRYYVKLEEI